MPQFGNVFQQAKLGLQTPLQQITQYQQFPWLRCLVPSLEQPGGALLESSMVIQALSIA